MNDDTTTQRFFFPDIFPKLVIVYFDQPQGCGAQGLPLSAFVETAPHRLKCRIMRNESLTIQDLGVKDGTRWLKLSGPLTLSTLFEFQTLVRPNNPNRLALDFTAVPYIDSAGVGVLVGAYVRHQKHGHKIVLVGVNSRVREALKVTRVESFFEYGVNPVGGPQSDLSEY